jgi:hypothetical protein
MRLAIAILGTLVAASVALAQSRDGFRGPFTGYEADVLADVWPEIRQAEDFGEINWVAHGLNRAPGSPEAQRFLTANWDELRREERFANIEWDDYRSHDDGPFSREEAAAMSRAWGQIREAARYEDIDWRALGLSGAPGSRQARRLMSEHWGRLREAGRFEDIDWQATGHGAR